ncbi:MAG: S8 family serine peptidase, partial [Thermoanaerobaculia bacterium]
MNVKLKIRFRRAACGLALILLAAPAALRAADPCEIRLIQQSWTPRAGVTTAAEKTLADHAAVARQHGRATVHALVQLYDIPDESQRAGLSRSGLELGQPLPGRAWIAALPVGQATALSHLPEVRWIEPWTAARKLHPRLRAGDVGPWARNPERPGMTMTMVLLHKDVDLAVGRELAERVGGVAMDPVVGIHGLTIWVPAERLADLAAEEEVLWIEEGPAPLSETNDGAQAQMNATPVMTSPYDLHGSGVNLFIYDGGRVQLSHETFDAGAGSRVTTLDGSAVSQHSTHVAGTAAGDGSGSTGLRGRGMAPEASIFSAGYQYFGGGMIFWDTVGDIENDYATARNDHEIDLANNSIGSNTSGNGYPCDREGDYGAASSLVDGIVRGSDAAVDGTVIMTWANGNERWVGSCGTAYHTTAEPSCAKNPLHVGAINSDGGSMTDFSSWGPCDDGRLKPIVVAPGCESGRVTGELGILSSVFDPLSLASEYDIMCGTSMAAPAVAGALTLLMEDWRGHIPFFLPSLGVPRLMPALVKSLAMHTARDLGTDGPDYRFGYGAVDARAMVDFERAAASGLSWPGLKVWGTDSVANGLTDSYTLTVPAGVGELKASLAWDDPAAASFSAVALINDLNLELTAPGGTVYRPWVLDPANPQNAATTGVNTLDNQEQVVVKNPAAGVWTVRVIGASVPDGPQSYGLVYSAEPRRYSDACTTTASGFESGNDGWTLTGATRVAAPAPGHGAFSIQLGGANSVVHEVSRSFTLPANQSARWSFDAFLTSTEGSTHGFRDLFYAEVRNSANTVLAVVNGMDGGDLAGNWLAQRNIDLTPWAGQTVKLVFRLANNGAKPSTFWIDDVQVTTCPASTPLVAVSLPSNGAQDGDVLESSETSSVGGTATANSLTIYGTAFFKVGDHSTDAQYKGFLSFDTSSLPDTATIVSARLVLRRALIGGTNPFDTHGNAWVDVRTGGFNGSVTLEPADFQAPETVWR